MTEQLIATPEQFLVPYWFEEHFFDFDWTALPVAGLRMYARSPDLDSIQLREITSIHELDDLPGWLPVTASQSSQVWNFPDERPLIGSGLVRFTKTSVDNQQVLSFVTKDGIPALIEEQAGWKFTTGVQGIEQETLSLAVLYLAGDYFGVHDPIVIITNQGIGPGTVLRGGSLFGMASYADDIPASVLTNTYTVDNRNIVSEYHTVHGIRTVTTQSRHNFVVHDLIYDQTWGGPFTSGYSRVINVISPYTYQVFDNSADTSYVASGDPIEVYVALTTNSFQPGTTLLKLPPLPFESTNVEHVWLRPQRMNLIANPSFEDADFGWYVGWTGSGTASFTQVTGGVDPTRPHCGEVSGTGEGRLILESNLFPVEANLMSVSAYVNGAGSLRLGVLAWGSSYRDPIYVHGLDTVVTDPVGPDQEYTFVTALIPAFPSAVEYSLRIEWVSDDPDAVVFYIDNVLVDPSDSQYEYFDGSSVTSFIEDYRWHGGNENQQFSMWYNNCLNTKARLLGGTDDEGVTYNQGLLDEWTPAGFGVIPHWEATAGAPVAGWTGDYFYPIKSTGSVLASPHQDYTLVLNPNYPNAVLDQSGAIVRDLFGEPILVDIAFREDVVLTFDDGGPLTTEDGDYLTI